MSIGPTILKMSLLRTPTQLRIQPKILTPKLMSKKEEFYWDLEDGLLMTGQVTQQRM